MTGGRFELGYQAQRRAGEAAALRVVAAMVADRLDPPAAPAPPVDLAAWRARFKPPEPEPAARPGAGSLAAEVRRLREEAKLTRADLSRLAGLGGGYAGRVERGQGRVRTSSLRRLAVALQRVGVVGDAEDLTGRLVALAGDALAPEADWARS